MKIFFGTGNTMIFTQVFLIGEKYPQKKRNFDKWYCGGNVAVIKNVNS